MIQNDNNRIVFNTIVKYVELVVNIFLGLVSVRFILQALGQEDYGIYMVVAGVVSMLNILSASMSLTSMRYMAHSLGKNDIQTARNTFSTSLFIHFLLGILSVLIFEGGGIIMFNHFLNIPAERFFDAQIVFQFVIVSTFISIITVPLDAVINAHENILFLSITSLFHNAMVFLLAIVLLHYEGDRLLFYGASLMTLRLLITVIKIVYTRIKYSECKLSLKVHDKQLLKSMLSFSGWELFATLSAMLTQQVRGLLINKFFGVRLNAGEGIAKQVNGSVNMVSVGITNAITPQMNKSAGSGDMHRLIQLVYTGVKFTSFMFGLFAIPLVLETSFVLKVWLKDVPEYTVAFCQLCIIWQFISKLTWQIGNAIRSIGDIKNYRIVCGSLSVVGIIVSFVLLAIGGGPLVIFYNEIFVYIIIGIVTLYFGKKIVGINPFDFIKKTTFPIIIPIAVSVGVSLFIQSFFSEGWLRLVIVCGVFIVLFSLFFWAVGTNEAERNMLKNMLKSFTNKISITILKR